MRNYSTKTKLSVAILLVVLVGLAGVLWLVQNGGQTNNVNPGHSTTTKHQNTNDPDVDWVDYSTETYTLQVPSQWQNTKSFPNNIIEIEFETENGFVIIEHFPLSKEQNDVTNKTDKVWIADYQNQQVQNITKSGQCSGVGERTFMGKKFICDANSKIKTRVSVYAANSLGFVTSNEQVVFSYTTKDNTKPGNDLKLLEQVLLSFRAT